MFAFSLSEGKLEALAILLQKLRSDSRRVLIFTQMVKMLDILEAFLDHRQLTYVRVDESFSPDERQVERTPVIRTYSVHTRLILRRDNLCTVSTEISLFVCCCVSAGEHEEVQQEQEGVLQHPHQPLLLCSRDGV